MNKDLICNVNSTLIDAWKTINKTGKGIVFIVNNEKKLVGVLTEGDIRNYLLEKQDFKTSISTVMNTDFVYTTVDKSYENIINLFNEKVKIIPVVDSAFRILDIYEYSLNIRLPVATPDLTGREFEYLTDAFLSTWISSSGPYIQRFENDFSNFCGVDFGVAVSNGTVALHLALVALDIGAGDEVIVPDLTFAATINAVLHAGAKPVIVDIESDSWCIDPGEIRLSVTSKTKAIIPVHLYGQPCNMDAIMEIADEHNLFVIEDCAEAHGAEYNGKKVGSFGHIGCFSFFGNKIITTGEGGMCISRNKSLANKMKILRDHGMSQNKKYWHDQIGFNYRMTNLQASIGVAQLERIESILYERKLIEQKYREILNQIEHIVFQKDDIPDRKKVTWFVSILIKENRDELLGMLNKEGIDARPFFYSLSRIPLYKEYLFSNKISSRISEKGINLPTISSMSDSFFKKIKNIILNNWMNVSKYE